MAIKETVPFNFNEVYTYIEDKFREKGYDVEEGSNTMQLVSAMSYLTSMLNVNTAVNINETILTQARKRDMVLLDARTLGYEIQHRQSYKYNLTLEFKTIGTFTIPRYAEFTSGDYTYYYMGDQITVSVEQSDLDEITYYSPDMPRTTVENLGGIWNIELGWGTFPTLTDVSAFEALVNDRGYTLESYTGIRKRIDVTEGILHKFSDNPDLLRTVITVDENGDLPTYIDVPFSNIEENGLQVFVSFIGDNGLGSIDKLWERSTSFMIDKDSDLKQQYIRLDNIDFSTPRVYFKIGDIGNQLLQGTIVEINALESNATLGEMLSTPSSSLSGFDVIEYKLVLQGAEEETATSVKTNAPLFHNTANRIITKNDYTAFCNRQSSVESSQIWDGNDEYPNRAGHIWFSFMPSNNVRSIESTNVNTNSNYELQNPYDKVNWYIEDSEITSVFNYLDNFKIPTLEFHHRHPVYFDFEYDIEVIKYSAATPKKDQNEEIFNVIDTYFNENNGVENFNFEYLNSNLIRRIDTTLTDNTGFNINLKTTVTLTDKNKINEEFDPCANFPAMETGAIYNEIEKITTLEDTTKYQFGTSVSKYGNTLVVGSTAQSKTTGGDDEDTDGGVVYIYEWNSVNNRYDFITELRSPDTDSNDFFGSSVAIYNDVIAIGAPLYDETIANEGAVYIYKFDVETNSYLQIKKITPNDAQKDDWFGAAVSISANKLAVSSTLKDIPFDGSQINNAGKVYIYEYAEDTFELRTTITSPNPAISDFFGSALALNASGNKIIVGAAGEDATAIDGGAVYVYEIFGSQFVEKAKITAVDAFSGDNFGISVSLYKNTSTDIERLVIGAWKKDQAGKDSGKIYVYEYNGVSYVQISQLTASDAIVDGGFGRSVSLNEDKLIVGAINSNLTNEFSGKVYVFGDYDNQINNSEVLLTYDETQKISKSGEWGNIISSSDGTIAIKNETENKIYVYEWQQTEYVEVLQIQLT